MKRSVIVTMALLLLVPTFSMAADKVSFENGQTETVANLLAPGFEATVNLEVPAGYYVKNATMKVTGMAAENNASVYPEGVTVKLDESVIWAFQQNGFGPLGMQNQFSTGQRQVNASFGSGGSVYSHNIRLPVDAIVQSATLDAKGFAPTSGQELANFLGGASWDSFGAKVACAGDLNNDGYDDVIVGAAGVDGSGTSGAGAAYIFFGGGVMDNTPGLILRGDNSGAFGAAVSSAGDVNKDGYDDVIVGEPLGGKAFLFFGGANMDNTSDLIIYEKGDEDWFAQAVSTAGDVNGDGYDDVIVGSRCYDAPFYHAGITYLFFGGKNMDNTEDVTFSGFAENNGLGYSVSDAGDVNGDGFDDVVIGTNANNAYIYFGAQNMDNQPDIVLTGEAPGDAFSDSVSCAGDVNGDGYPDIIIGARYNHAGGEHAGRAYIYYGGQALDNDTDIVLTGFAAFDLFGYTSHGAGDVNNDGYDDVIVGADGNDSGGNGAGSAYVFFGGPNMDTDPDMTFLGEAAGDTFGHVSEAGDVNKDGYGDVLIGAGYNDESGVDAGAAYIYTLHVSNFTGILNPGVSVGSKSIWKETGYFNKTSHLPDFANDINAYLASAAKSGNDSYKNAYVDVPLKANASSAGRLELLNLKIIYSYNATVPNFSSPLNNYLVVHKNEKDANGNIQVPIKIRSQTAGWIMLSGLDLTPDEAPKIVKDIGSTEILEDSWNSTLVDLYAYFQDDADPDTTLDFSLVSSTNATYVTVGIRNKRYVVADAFTGDANDNWTGTVEVVVACFDRMGQKTESNQFTITVKNVNDEPLITSTPVLTAEAGVMYRYKVTAIDGDNDRLRFSLPKGPPNMTIDADSGEIRWMPCARGDFNVTTAVSDGTVTVEQSFTVKVPNKAPRITSQAPLNATTGAKYTYTVTAEDDNLDALTYSLTSKIIGMEIGPINGTITWTPEYVNDYDVVVIVSDGKATAMQEFTVKVTQGNRAPKFISVPVKTAVVGLPYEYQAKAMDEDKDGVSFSLVEPPAGMTIQAGKVSWTPSAAGSFTVKIKASDGRGGEKLQEFVIEVKEKVRPTVLVQRPAANEKVKGKFTVSGTAVKGTLEVANVQVRVDGGDWVDAAGNYTWQYGLDTTKLKNGKHRLEARAFDGNDYSDIAKVDFSVDNQKAQAKGFIPMTDGWMLILLLAAAGTLVSARRQKGI